MIVGFVGTPGSGKSLDAIRKIVDNLKMGRVCYTNISGTGDAECQEALKALSGLDDYTFHYQFHYLSDVEIVRYWEHCKPGSFILVDEVHKLIKNRDWQSQKNKDFGDNASTHRHDCYDILLITQDIDKVDTHVRGLIEWTYFYRKMNFFGSLVKKKFLVYCYSGDDHKGSPLAKQTRTYDPKYYHCYKSYSFAAAKEVNFMTHVNVLKHPVFIAIPIILLITLYMFFSKSSFATSDPFGAKKKLNSAPVPVSAAPTPLYVTAPVVPVPLVVPDPLPAKVVKQKPVSLPRPGPAPVQVNKNVLVRVTIDSFASVNAHEYVIYKGKLISNFKNYDETAMKADIPRDYAE